MPEPRTFATDPGAGGEESEYLGLPFKSTACEDWYGFGNKRCPNRYVETGDLEKDIESLIKWIGHYSGHGRTGWMVWATNELYKKREEQSKILAQQPAKETTLPSIYGGQFVPPTSTPIDLSQYTSFGQLVMDYYPLPEAAAEQEITLPSIYGGQYVPGVEPVPFTPMVVEYATSVRDPIPITTDQVEPPIEPEPEEPYVFSKCVDVYRVGVAKSVYSVRETVGYETLSNYTGQGLLVRECGQSIPSDQEVRDFYGVSAPVDPETCLCGIKLQTGATVCKECPPTPTEERPVKWIPEPFFSFINEVFRR